jgi:hypothetical protein
MDPLYIFSFLRRNSKTPTGKSRTKAEEWLRGIGWEYRSDGYGGSWYAPGDNTDHSFTAAMMYAPIWEAAKILREKGWLAPHRPGLWCHSDSCRAPGTWRPIENGRQESVRGSRGRWLNIRQAFRKEFGL